MEIEHYTYCPACDSTNIREVMMVKDHSVSGESFPITECLDCTLRFTQDVPSANSISPYYKSENYISHTNTSKGIVNRMYQFVRKRTLAGKRKLVVRHTGTPSGELLDVGSGVGSFVHEMKTNGWNVTGLEPDADARKVAKDTYKVALNDSQFLYKLPPGTFHAITMWHVLEHVHELHPYLQHISKLLTASGRLFVAVPNYTSYDAAVYRDYWAAYDVPRHLYHFSPASMKMLMEKNGMEIVSYEPMWYDSFYISILSSKYRNGSTNWLSAAWNGLRSNMQALGDVKKCSSVIYVIRRKSAALLT